MNRSAAIPFVVLALALATLGSGGCAPQDITPVIAQDVEILRLFKVEGAVPPEKVREARAVAIVSRVEAAAVVGGSGGEGLVMKRLEHGWSSPAAVSAVSGTFGFQLGGRGQQLVLLFMTEESIDKFITSGSYSLAQAVGTGGNASTGGATAGQSDGVEPYSRSGGLFGSAAVGGVGFSVDEPRNRATYGVSGETARILSGRVTPPPGTYTLWAALDDLAK
ncbi:MAG: lipid-binding SYLF domain-containing protein [Phycisphaerales bacterium]|nr:lipid-binding SYLF domain-containing protein [Phycisphaerales bacterium]